MSQNNIPSIDIFSEGQTEKGIIEKLCQRGICSLSVEERGQGGEQEMLRKLGVRLRAWFDLAQDQRELLYILVLRDLDSHNNKTVDSICSSTLSLVRRHDISASLEPLPEHDNVFRLRSNTPRLRLILHIACHGCFQQSIKTTIDDYVLTLALRPATAKLLLERKRKSGLLQQPQRNWEIGEAELIEKVKQEIPDLLHKNKIPPLMEAKEYLRFYAAVLQDHTTPAVFASKVLTHAEEQDIREVFAPLLAAIQLLSGDLE